MKLFPALALVAAAATVSAPAMADEALKESFALDVILLRSLGINVVVVHGGPVARDHWAWDAEVQLLAARGYVVFQPQFRGSSGFGKRFEAAGYGQWGLDMQDDITAGVEHLVRQGVADPARICIYGASYGGYAAVWGLIKTPALYRCGASLAGVSDIAMALSDTPDGHSGPAVHELQRHLIGDLERDRERLRQVSPLERARDIRAPLLIAHGDEDLRVPHMVELFGAFTATGHDVGMFARGISVALYNTAMGIVVAVPSMIFYRHFRAKVDGLIVEMEQQAIKLVEILHGERK